MSTGLLAFILTTVLAVWLAVRAVRWVYRAIMHQDWTLLDHGYVDRGRWTR